MNKPLEIFLLIGQSNMAGRGPLDTVPALRHPNVRMFRNGEWVSAEEPLHTDKPEIAGIGLGMSFALALLEREPNKVIGLVPCAVGGTPLHRWMPGADLYAYAVAATVEAMAGGVLKGILWHQGEADSHRDEEAQTYGQRLRKMIGALRTDIHALNAPFVAGELGEFLENYEEGCAFFRVVNAQIRGLCDRAPRFGCVSSSGLKDKGDDVHFDSASLREFGRRYAQVHQRLIEKEEGRKI